MQALIKYYYQHKQEEQTMTITKVVFLVEREIVAVVTEENGRMQIANTNKEALPDFKYDWTEQEIIDAVTALVG